MISYKFFIMSLSSAWMMGIGLRFIFDGYVNSNTFAVPLFDAIFDYGVLFFLGLVLFIYSIIDINNGGVKS